MNQNEQKAHARAMAIKNGSGHGFIDDLKEAMNTRVDEKTGRYYVKGQKGQSGRENRFSGLGETVDDPNL